MNPSYLFSLSESKRALYRNQPDLAQGLQISEPEEYEHPPFVENAALRLWYNEQTDRYMTHWHNATDCCTGELLHRNSTKPDFSSSTW